MCRMLGMAAARPTSVRDLLHDAPRSLRVLSEEHADGWGIALRRNEMWTVKRSTTCAARCASYAGLDQETVLTITHIRKKTVGDLSLANTQPNQHNQNKNTHNNTNKTTPHNTATAPE